MSRTMVHWQRRPISRLRLTQQPMLWRPLAHDHRKCPVPRAGQNRATAFLQRHRATIVGLYKRIFVVSGISRRPSAPTIENRKRSCRGSVSVRRKGAQFVATRRLRNLPRTSSRLPSLFRRSESFPQERSLAAVRGRTHSLDSQKYAARTLRAALTWVVAVRYLGPIHDRP